MLKTSMAAVLATLFLGSLAVAETFEIKMLNKAEAGQMVFEPAFLSANVGDTILFIPASKGHNAETIKDMLPEGAEQFKSKLSKELSVTLTAEGIYGIKCTPHYSMGMIALIQVGSPVNLDTAKSVKHKGKAAKRFDTLFEQVH